MSSPIEEAMQDFAIKREGMKCIEGHDHNWRYSNKSDEVYCTGCGGVDAGYRGMGVTLLEIKKLLEDIKSGGLK